MKKFNGTDYDNLLPLAYNALNSNLLNGKSYKEIVEIVGTGGENCRIAYGNYLGNGKSGAEFPNSIECGFCPLLVMVSDQNDSQYWALRGISGFYHSDNRGNVMMWGDTGVSWYYPRDGQYFSTAGLQFNEIKRTYYYLVLGYSTVGEQGGIYPERKEWLITGNTTWTVPYTGNYFVELYGGGGWGDGSHWYSDNVGTTHTILAEGGSSCQSYESLLLTKNSKMTITIGTGAYYDSLGKLVNATGTNFRTYSVAGGGNGQVLMASDITNIQAIGGAGAGNKGTTRAVDVKGDASARVHPNYSKGIYAKHFGYSNGFAPDPEGGYSDHPARAGAVYIKYLGA